MEAWDCWASCSFLAASSAALRSASALAAASSAAFFSASALAAASSAAFFSASALAAASASTFAFASASAFSSSSVDSPMVGSSVVSSVSSTCSTGWVLAFSFCLFASAHCQQHCQHQCSHAQNSSVFHVVLSFVNTHSAPILTHEKTRVKCFRLKNRQK